MTTTTTLTLADVLNASAAKIAEIVFESLADVHGAQLDAPRPAFTETELLDLTIEAGRLDVEDFGRGAGQRNAGRLKVRAGVAILTRDGLLLAVAGRSRNGRPATCYMVP